MLRSPPPAAQFGINLSASRSSLPMRVYSLTACFVSLCAQVAVAQWNPSATMQLGMGYGQIALSQSILSGTRTMLGDEPVSTTRRVPANRAEPALTYTPDPSLSEQTRTAMIEAVSRNN